jgi:NADH dehydrogenase FAD-containing subunit
MTPTSPHHRVLIIGGGSAGISVAARLAEFDDTLKPRPSFPIINTTKERRDMW